MKYFLGLLLVCLSATTHAKVVECGFLQKPGKLERKSNAHCFSEFKDEKGISGPVCTQDSAESGLQNIEIPDFHLNTETGEVSWTVLEGWAPHHKSKVLNWQKKDGASEEEAKAIVDKITRSPEIRQLVDYQLRAELQHKDPITGEYLEPAKPVPAHSLLFGDHFRTNHLYYSELTGHAILTEYTSYQNDSHTAITIMFGKCRIAE